MSETICLDGKTIALDIKRRCRAARVTVKQVCREAEVSYRAYLSWRGSRNNPSFASLKPIYAVLERHEANIADQAKEGRPS